MKKLKTLDIGTDDVLIVNRKDIPAEYCIEDFYEVGSKTYIIWRHKDHREFLASLE